MLLVIKKNSPSVLNIVFVGLKARHKLKLEEVCLMLSVYKLSFRLVFYFSCSDVFVKLGIGEAEIILVCLSAKSVYRCFVNKLTRKSEKVAYFLRFLYCAYSGEI